jgi:hypothetical protein
MLRRLRLSRKVTTTCGRLRVPAIRFTRWDDNYFGEGETLPKFCISLLELILSGYFDSYWRAAASVGAHTPVKSLYVLIVPQLRGELRFVSDRYPANRKRLVD